MRHICQSPVESTSQYIIKIFGFSIGSNSLSTDAFLFGCDSTVQIYKSISLPEMVTDNYNFLLKASLDYPYTEKGCGRDTHGLSELLKKCGLTKSVFLLPENIADARMLKWLNDVQWKVTELGNKKSYIWAHLNQSLNSS